jgi:hypothetical protein
MGFFDHLSHLRASSQSANPIRYACRSSWRTI